MRFAHYLKAALTLAACALPLSAVAQVELTPVVSGLTSPVFVGNADDNLNRLFIVEQPGVIKVLQSGSTIPTVFLDIQTKVLDGGERGLLGLAFHPQYASNGRFFVFYTRDGDGALVIAEYGASPASANTAGTTERILLTIPHPSFANHNGGMLAFGPDGYLHIGVGDGGSFNDPGNNAQNRNTLLGKLLRIDVDGGLPYAIPADNPFVGVADTLPEIYAYGFRNPWRFSFDRETGAQWVGDVGQGAREEVDTPIVGGGNYGWRIFEGNLCTEIDSCANPENYIFPAFDYDHSNGRCSLTGGYVYRGALGAVARGTYVFGDYCSGEIFTWNGSNRATLLDTELRISSFGEDEDGELYVIGLGGTVSRLTRNVVSCSYAITPTKTTFNAAGGTGSITVTSGAGCPWTAAPSDQWITITSGPGDGNGTVTYTVAPYTGKAKKRNGSITVGGRTLTIQQSR